MSSVFPGLEEVLAIVCRHRLLMSDDLPTLLLPIKAYSGNCDAGHCATSGLEMTKVAVRIGIRKVTVGDYVLVTLCWDCKGSVIFLNVQLADAKFGFMSEASGEIAKFAKTNFAQITKYIPFWHFVSLSCGHRADIVRTLCGHRAYLAILTQKRQIAKFVTFPSVATLIPYSPAQTKFLFLQICLKIKRRKVDCEKKVKKSFAVSKHFYNFAVA